MKYEFSRGGGKCPPLPPLNETLCNTYSCLLTVLCMFADFGASGEEVEFVEVEEYVGDPAYGTATTQLHKVYQSHKAVSN